MSSVQNSLALHKASTFLGAAPSSRQLQKPGGVLCCGCRRSARVGRVRAEASQSTQQDEPGRRQLLALGTTASCLSMTHPHSASLAAESKKGYIAVSDKKDGYSLIYPFGWQEVVVQGQDKVFKDVIEPLESVSVNCIPTNKGSIQELGSPQEVAETLIRKVLAPPSQKTKLLEAAERDVGGTIFYTFEFLAQAPNFTRHALGSIAIANGKFYTLTTGANERRWEKMKDRLRTVIESFKVSSV